MSRYPRIISKEIQSPWRKQQAKDNFYKKKYGIGLSEYNLMLMDQSSCCAICSVHQSELNRALAIDHCHASKKVRKLLCSSCNMGLGQFKDNSDLLLKAVEYLKETA